MKKRWVVLILAGILCIGGCRTTAKGQKDTEKEQDPYTKEVYAMDTYMTLTAYGRHGEEAIDHAQKEIERIEQLVSTGIADSEITKLNENKTEKVSQDTKELIKRSLDLYRETDGVFDISIYPLMLEWGFPTQKYHVPDKEKIEEELEGVNAEDIKIQSDGTVSLENEKMQIDLGGIAKGYTSQKLIGLMREQGVESAVVSLGGNVEVLGKKPDQTPWRVAIESPKKDGSYLGVLKVTDKAVITSGGYERYFEQDGNKYHHILDPKTGYPAQSGLTSVTIVSEDGTLADGLSTALFIMGRDQAIDFWRAHREEFDMILMEEDGTLTITEGIEKQFITEEKKKVIYAKE